VALLAVGLVGLVLLGFARQNAIKNCDRGNLLRAESNRRIAAHRADRDVLRDFLKSAAVARRQTGDVQVAREYDALRRRLAAVTFRSIPPVDCRHAVRLVP
jgi:hypothetical protein